MMTFEEIFPATIGSSIMQRAQHRQQASRATILCLISGPTSYASIAKGFRENFNLPTGGGKSGELFGSPLAAPTLHACTSLSGRTLISSRSLIGFLPSVGFGVDNQKLSSSSHSSSIGGAFSSFESTSYLP